jgi:hypothetical protein
MAPNWDRLIRFISTDGRELRGEPILPSADFDVGTTTEETGLTAKVIDVANGDIFAAETKVTDEVVTVKKLLGPVTTDEVPIIRCIGLNFIKHSKFPSLTVWRSPIEISNTPQFKKAAALSHHTPAPSSKPTRA